MKANAAKREVFYFGVDQQTKKQIQDLFKFKEGSQLMHDIVYYLIIVIYYFWYFYVKNVILGLGDLFPYF